MFLYDFISKVQDAESSARRKAEELNNQQMHGQAHVQKARAKCFNEVLTWAGFEGCVVVKEEVLADKDAQIEELREALRKLEVEPSGPVEWWRRRAREAWLHDELDAYEDDGQWYVDLPVEAGPAARVGGATREDAFRRAFVAAPVPDDANRPKALS